MNGAGKAEIPVTVPTEIYVESVEIGIGHEDIALRAYAIYEARIEAGTPGDETSDWLQAEAELIPTLDLTHETPVTATRFPPNSGVSESCPNCRRTRTSPEANCPQCGVAYPD